MFWPENYWRSFRDDGFTKRLVSQSWWNRGPTFFHQWLIPFDVNLNLDDILGIWSAVITKTSPIDAHWYATFTYIQNAMLSGAQIYNYNKYWISLKFISLKYFWSIFLPFQHKVHLFYNINRGFLTLYTIIIIILLLL